MPNKRLKRDCQRVVVTVVVIEFSGFGCCV